jgi:hypothetical protein
MLYKIPEFDHHYVAYLKNDPAKEPIAASYSAPGVLAEAAQHRWSNRCLGATRRNREDA